MPSGGTTLALQSENRSDLRQAVYGCGRCSVGPAMGGRDLFARVQDLDPAVTQADELTWTHVSCLARATRSKIYTFAGGGSGHLQDAEITGCHECTFRFCRPDSFSTDGNHGDLLEYDVTASASRAAFSCPHSCFLRVAGECKYMDRHYPGQ